MAGSLVRFRGVDCKAANLHAPAANTAAIITLAAVADKRHHIAQIIYSYSGAPAGGRLSITDGGVTVFDQDITSGGSLGPLQFSNPLRFAVNSAVVITLAAGGGTVVGKLNVHHYFDT